MTDTVPSPVLDAATRSLVDLAAAIAQGEEPDIRDAIDGFVKAGGAAAWGDELMLQSALICGWPRALVAARIWRKAVPEVAEETVDDMDYASHEEWTGRGTETCQAVYGDHFDRLKRNIRELHPAFASWMITEAYGRTLSRPGLDIGRRELCVIAQTAVLDTPRQLRSHLIGALNVGVSPDEVEEALGEVNPYLSYDHWKAVKELWEHVREGWSDD